jgi:hypothetical protein
MDFGKAMPGDPLGGNSGPLIEETSGDRIDTNSLHSPFDTLFAMFLFSATLQHCQVET